jgi:hypothetical protein
MSHPSEGPFGALAAPGDPLVESLPGDDRSYPSRRSEKFSNAFCTRFTRSSGFDRLLHEFDAPQTDQIRTEGILAIPGDDDHGDFDPEIPQRLEKLQADRSSTIVISFYKKDSDDGKEKSNTIRQVEKHRRGTTYWIPATWIAGVR